MVVFPLVPVLALTKVDKPNGKPNIIFVLTDDEDTVLGGDGVEAMPKGLPAISARGATAANWFVHTPVCACSRSEILTGV